MHALREYGRIHTYSSRLFLLQLASWLLLLLLNMASGRLARSQDGALLLAW